MSITTSLPRRQSHRLLEKAAGLSAPARRVAELLEDPDEYIFQGAGIELRPYQVEPIPRIMDSIHNHYGDTIVIIFPRQSGKDEFLVHFKTYLLDLFSPLPVGIVEVNPTYKPQTATAMTRFDQALSINLLTHNRWDKRAGFMRIIGLAKVAFLSGAVMPASEPTTAVSIALTKDEARRLALAVLAYIAAQEAARAVWALWEAKHPEKAK